MDKEAPISRKEYEVYVPTHPCYKDNTRLCGLRQYPDSRFSCMFKEPDLCQFGRIKVKGGE